MKKIEIKKLLLLLQAEYKKRISEEVALNCKLSVVHVRESISRESYAKNKTLIKIANELGFKIEIRENINGKEYWKL